MIHDISCIVPIKDATELPYLVSLLDDLCRQTEKYRLEIVIVASDDIKKIIDQTYRLKDRFEYVPPITVRDLSGYEGKDVIVHARNWGASNSEGSILVFLDCDNSLNSNFVESMTVPIIQAEYVMTWTQPRYNEDMKTEKELKLIKYNNFLLRFDPVPKIPFAINKEVFREIGGLKAKNTYISFSGALLWKYPGSIKKIDTEVLVSPRNILKRAREKKNIH